MELIWCLKLLVQGWISGSLYPASPVVLQKDPRIQLGIWRSISWIYYYKKKKKIKKECGSKNKLSQREQKLKCSG